MEVRMRWMEITLIVLPREVNVRSRLTTITRRQLGGSTWGRWSASAISIYSTERIMREVGYSLRGLSSTKRTFYHRTIGVKPMISFAALLRLTMEITVDLNVYSTMHLLLQHINVKSFYHDVNVI